MERDAEIAARVIIHEQRDLERKVCIASILDEVFQHWSVTKWRRHRSCLRDRCTKGHSYSREWAKAEQVRSQARALEATTHFQAIEHADAFGACELGVGRGLVQKRNEKVV
jgi:hypothetical protein